MSEAAIHFNARTWLSSGLKISKKKIFNHGGHWEKIWLIWHFSVFPVLPVVN